LKTSALVHDRQNLHGSLPWTASNNPHSPNAMPSHPTPSAKSQQAVDGAATHVASVRVHMYVFRPGRGYLRQRRVRKPNDMCAHPELLMDLLGLL